MFTLDKFQNTFLALSLKSETSYYYLKDDYRKISKEDLNDLFESFSLIDKEKTLDLYRKSIVFMKEDDDYFYFKNVYDTIPLTFDNFQKFFDKFNSLGFDKNYKFIGFNRSADETKFFNVFNKNFDLIFPELVFYFKKEI